MVAVGSEVSMVVVVALAAPAANVVVAVAVASKVVGNHMLVSARWI